jgi:hypothetical protein
VDAKTQQRTKIQGWNFIKRGAEILMETKSTSTQISA